MSEAPPKPRKRSKTKSGTPPLFPAQVALEQIRTKQYDLPFRNRGKTILLLGIAFDQTNRNISGWQMAQA